MKYVGREVYRKYKNEKIKVGGIEFDSKLELKIYGRLLTIPKIKKIVTHVRISISHNGVKICDVFPDFEIHAKNGEIFYADAKSEATETAVSALKFRLILAYLGKKVYILPKETALLDNALGHEEYFYTVI